MKSIKRTIIYSTILLDIIVLGYALFLAFYPFKTLEVEQPIRITTTQVVPGENLVYTNKYCKYVNLEANTLKSLVPEDASMPTYILPSTRSNIPTGCHTLANRSTTIPNGVASGKYHLQFSSSYRVNPLRTITVQFVTEPFTITTAIMTTQTFDPPITQQQAAALSAGQPPTYAGEPAPTAPYRTIPDTTSAPAPKPASTPQPTTNPAPAQQNVIQRVLQQIGTWI